MDQLVQAAGGVDPLVVVVIADTMIMGSSL
jgi:hypothetical protein